MDFAQARLARQLTLDVLAAVGWDPGMTRLARQPAAVDFRLAAGQDWAETGTRRRRPDDEVFLWIPIALYSRYYPLPHHKLFLWQLKTRVEIRTIP